MLRRACNRVFSGFADGRSARQLGCASASRFLLRRSAGEPRSSSS